MAVCPDACAVHPTSFKGRLPHHHLIYNFPVSASMYNYLNSSIVISSVYDMLLFFNQEVNLIYCECSLGYDHNSAFI